jgi:adenylate cyclase
LAAIMFTDMVGYTALGQRNEPLSLALVEEQRRLIRPVLAKHNGREIKTMGDAFFVEFPSALEAVRCAYDIQRVVREFNFSLAEDKRVHLRIGIHLGDVVETNGDVSGDAVNLASRVEPLASDGGVCLTREVYSQVANKFDLPLRSLGVRNLKNVVLPAEIYRVVMPWEEEKLPPEPHDRRRLAVLPFSNFSPDPNDEYFADGMTEELITKLSEIEGLRVIARTSVMSYKKKEKVVSEIARELGVGSLIEGSVRKAGNRVRITAQLIDALNQEHLWAANYDRTLDDIFEIQRDVAAKVAASIPAAVLSKTEKKDTESLEAYTLYLKATQLIHQGNEQGLREAVKLLDRAVSMDPGFVRAYAGLSHAWTSLSTSAGEDGVEDNQKAESAARKALELGPDFAEAHSAMATVYAALDKHEECVAEAAKAVQINPSLADAYLSLGMESSVLGRIEEGLQAFQRGQELNPLSFDLGAAVAFALFFSGREQEALASLEKLRQIYPRNGMACVAKARLLMSLHRYDDAQKMLDAANLVEPNLPFQRVNQGLLYALTGRRTEAEEVLEEITKDRNEFVQQVGRLAIGAGLGDINGAVSALNTMAENHAWDWMMLYWPQYSALRKDPRFEEFLTKVGLSASKRSVRDHL